MIADIDIFAKAARWSMEFPEEYFNQRPSTTRSLPWTRVLDRAHQLLKGQSPWKDQKGRVVRGYYSDLDGSVQPVRRHYPCFV